MLVTCCFVQLWEALKIPQRVAAEGHQQGMLQAEAPPPSGSSLNLSLIHI